LRQQRFRTAKFLKRNSPASAGVAAITARLGR
jgi:hypothetical protein